MPLRLLYMFMIRVFGWLMLLVRSQYSKGRRQVDGGRGSGDIAPAVAGGATMIVALAGHERFRTPRSAVCDGCETAKRH